MPWKTCSGNDFLLVEVRKTKLGSPTSAPGFLHLFTHKTLAMSFESILKDFKTKCPGFPGRSVVKNPPANAGDTG